MNYSNVTYTGAPIRTTIGSSPTPNNNGQGFGPGAVSTPAANPWMTAATKQLGLNIGDPSLNDFLTTTINGMPNMGQTVRDAMGQPDLSAYWDLTTPSGLASLQDAYNKYKSSKVYTFDNK